MDAVRLRPPSPDLRRSSSCDRDVMRPPRSSSDFTSKKLNADHGINGCVPPSFICEENVDTHYFEETDKPTLLSTNHGVSHRKSLKKLGTLPCSKRMKTGHPEHSIKIDEFKDLVGTARQIGSATIQFPCPGNIDKLQTEKKTEKKKRRKDGKTADKKNNRASKRSKCDPCVSKAGFFCLDSASGGNNMPGIHGHKSVLQGVTKHVDDLSLNGLLDGSYKYASIRPEKGKKPSSANENILLSVRKAFSILPTPGAVDSNGNSKAPSRLPQPNSYPSKLSDSADTEKNIEDSMPYGKFVRLKIGDAFPAYLDKSALFHPKVVLEKLALPSVSDQDALSNFSITSPPLQSTKNATALSLASLPLWSSSHSGFSSRSTCHGGWVRIGSNSTSEKDYHCSSSDLDLRTKDQQKIDDLLQYVRNSTAPSHALSNEASDLRAMAHVSGGSITDGTASVKICEVNETKDSKMVQEHDAGGTHGYSDSCHSDSCRRDGVLGLPAPEVSRSGNSPRAIRAAEILCDMASCSRTISPRSNTSEKTRWPKAPSEKTMKARKSTSSGEKTERLYPSADNYDSARSQRIPSIKHNSTSEKNGFTHQNNSSRAPVRWSGALEKDPRVHPSLPHCNPIKIASPMPSSTRVDYGSQQKLRRVMMLKGSSVGFGGTSYIKDWSSRGRTKRI